MNRENIVDVDGILLFTTELNEKEGAEKRVIDCIDVFMQTNIYLRFVKVKQSENPFSSWFTCVCVCLYEQNVKCRNVNSKMKSQKQKCKWLNNLFIHFIQFYQSNLWD